MTQEQRPMILIHDQGDLDCYAFAWLWLRFGPKRFQEAEVRFTNLAKPNQLLIARATVVGDLDGYYDPEAGFFDHHQDASLPCAAQLAWEWLNHDGSGDRAAGELDYLWPLIELIDQYDRGTADTRTSKFTNQFGPHAILTGHRLQCREWGEPLSDSDALVFTCNMLDSITANLKHQYDAYQAVQHHAVYISDDRQFIALYDCNKATCFAALEQGYKLVAFHSFDNMPDGARQHHVGIMHNKGLVAKDDPLHCGELVRFTTSQARLQQHRNYEQLAAEFDTWYLDERGFFAGRSAKSNQHQPPLVSIEVIAQAIDAAWQR